MNAPDQYRRPQHSVEAEQSLIGALLLDNTAWDRVADLIRESDFYRDEHRRIFRHAARLIDQGKPADVVTVFESLDKSGEAQNAGGLAYLGELANNTPSASNIRRYAEIVCEKAMLRGVMSIADQMQAECAAPSDMTAAEIASKAETSLSGLTDRSDSEPEELKDTLCKVLTDIDARREQSAGLAGLATGFNDLDQRTGGLEPGQLIIVAARPSVGKTIFACNVADHIASAGTPVLFFTMEMSAQEIGQRILASRSGVSMHAMRSGTNDAGDWERMSAATGRANGVPLFIDERAAVSVPYIRAKARKLQRAKGLGLIVIDYLGLMRADGKQQNRTQEIGSISRGLKQLAKELRVPIICLAQLNRASEGRTDRRPTLADLRDSGEIEQDADIVAMLHRESLYSPNAPEWNGLAELLVRKLRNGPIGDCLLVFDGTHMRFSTYTGTDPRTAPATQNNTQRKGFE